MISFVKGTVADIGENCLVVENGGIGYEIYMTGQDLGKARIGDEKKIHTFLYVREDILQLYGFFSKDDLGMFKLLIGVNGEFRHDAEVSEQYQAPPLIREKPELIREIVDAGHTIGNHTMTHPDMSGISTKEAFQKQLEDVEVLYKEATGKEMTKFYRPPQGIYSTKNLEMAKELGYHTFFWSLAYVDWYQDKQPSKEEAFEKLLGRIHPGAIVLLHSTSSTNASILDELLTKWEEMGYTFGTLEELVASGSA